MGILSGKPLKSWPKRQIFWLASGATTAKATSFATPLPVGADLLSAGLAVCDVERVQAPATRGRLKTGEIKPNRWLTKDKEIKTVSVGILGTKLGMTQIFDGEGKAIPVTVVQAGPCTITQIKTTDTDGYSAIQVGYGEVKNKTRELNTKTPKTVNKYLSNPEQGHLAKSGAPMVRHLCEYRVEDAASFELGGQIKVDSFEAGQLVDVIGTSIGKGFAGYQRRHNFKRGAMSHGSKNHRQPGSVGAGTTPGRVYPGKRMAGRLGGTQVTIRKLTVFRVDSDRNLLLIKGAIPGKPGTLVNVKPAKKVG